MNDNEMLAKYYIIISNMSANVLPNLKQQIVVEEIDSPRVHALLDLIEEVEKERKERCH